MKKYLIDNATRYKLTLFGITYWAYYYHKTYRFGWFRIFGLGLKYKHIDNGLTFSERNGYTKFLRIGKWIIGYLPLSTRQIQRLSTIKK